LESVLSKNLDLPDVVWNRLRSETDHEKRATLICLLTAALGGGGTAAIIGEAEGGWFWLPPWSLSQPWATEGLETAAKEAALKASCVLDRPFSPRSDDLIANRLIKRALDPLRMTLSPTGI
jgi:hypothetical protein